MSYKKASLEPMKALPPRMRMAAARAAATEAMPYFATGINALVPYVEQGTMRIYVTEHSVLGFDPELLAHWTAPEAGAVVLHEHMHIFLRHSARQVALLKSGVMQDTAEDRGLLNQAFDCEINDNIEAAGLPLPAMPLPDGTTSPPCTPKTLNLPPHRSGEEYFLTLKQRRKPPSDKKPPPGGGGSGQGQQPPPPNWGCGSGAGNPQPKEPNAPDGPQHPQLGRDTVEQDLDRKSQAQQILQRHKSKGDVPLGLVRLAEGELPKSKISWEDELRHEVLEAAAYHEGQGDYTWLQPYRGQSALIEMFGDDAPSLPGEHQPQAKVAAVVDTSGSMGPEDLLACAVQVKAILETLGGISLTFLAVDAEVHVMREMSDIKEVLANFKGGGGTSFVPAFRALKKQTPRPDVIVYLTDGFGDEPEEPKGWGKTIWVITPRGRGSVPWGKTIYMGDRPEADEDDEAA